MFKNKIVWLLVVVIVLIVAASYWFINSRVRQPVAVTKLATAAPTVTRYRVITSIPSKTPLPTATPLPAILTSEAAAGVAPTLGSLISVTPSSVRTTYQDPYLGFTFRYPSNWYIEVNSDKTAAQVANGGSFVMVRSFTVMGMTKGGVPSDALKIDIHAAPSFAKFGTIEEWLKSNLRSSGLSGAALQARLSQVERFQMDGVPAIHLPSENGVFGTVIAFGEGDWLYYLVAYPGSSDFLGTFHEIAKSFKLCRPAEGCMARYTTLASVLAVPPSQERTKYHHPEVGFSFKYPSNWKFESKSRLHAGRPARRGVFATITSLDVMGMKRGDMPKQLFQIEFQAKPGFAEYGTIAEWFEQNGETLGTTSGVAPIVKESNVNGVPALRWETTENGGSVGVIFGNGDWLYRFEAYPLDSDYMATFDEILASFQTPN